MEYIVSYWTGEKKQHGICKDKETAEEKRMSIKARSAALPDVSLEPVRIMPLGVFQKMNELLRINIWNGTCRHSTLKRLCITCVGEEAL